MFHADRFLVLIGLFAVLTGCEREAPSCDGLELDAWQAAIYYPGEECNRGRSLAQTFCRNEDDIDACEQCYVYWYRRAIEDTRGSDATDCAG